MNANEIQIGRRTFQVATQTTKRGEFQYVLTGKRGATYCTSRNFHHTDRMFLIDARGFGMAKGYEGVWLTDKNGVLEVL